MKRTVQVSATVKVTVNDGSDAISRCFTDDWRKHYWSPASEVDVIEHFAFNCVANGIEDAARLDGWSDLDYGECTMEVDRDAMDIEVERDRG